MLLVRDVAEGDELAGQVRASATELRARIALFGGDGIGLLRALKIDQVGFHPLDGHALNAIEQVHQIWTYPAALSRTGFRGSLVARVKRGRFDG